MFVFLHGTCLVVERMPSSALVGGKYKMLREGNQNGKNLSSCLCSRTIWNGDREGTG